MNKDYDSRFTSNTIFNIPESRLEVIIRNIKLDDINDILQLQEASFADMAAYGMVWPPLF